MLPTLSTQKSKGDHLYTYFYSVYHICQKLAPLCILYNQGLQSGCLKFISLDCSTSSRTLADLSAQASTLSFLSHLHAAQMAGQWSRDLSDLSFGQRQLHFEGEAIQITTAASYCIHCEAKVHVSLTFAKFKWAHSSAYHQHNKLNQQFSIALDQFANNNYKMENLWPVSSLLSEITVIYCIKMCIFFLCVLQYCTVLTYTSKL